MIKNKKVLLGMSGGVDSSVSAILLKERGFEVVGITMQLWCDDGTAAKDAKIVCDKLGIEHHVVNFENEFKQYVIDDFVTKYFDAKTPNPCVECNRYLKFGMMWEKARELGIDYMATGHYAKTKFSKKYNRYVIAKSDSIKKDQSYVLYNIQSDIIEHIIFPLQNFESKEEIRKIAIDHGLSIASKPDSQEICFIPDNEYANFLLKNTEKSKQKYALKSGDIIDVKGNVRGKHTGIIHYTIGQRKGLGIQNEKPLYVIKIDNQNNRVIVGEKEDTYAKEAFASDINLLAIDKIDKQMEVMAKIRYAAKEAKASIFPTEDEAIIKIVFEEPQMAITPGQSIVFYDDDIVIGGGKIL
ncbi:MAG: tRNA 2-thiouridine(34) synthase MnmA [Clostridia bacterium]|nr:tRNA 2-thiouridine(34) synthase MnmA [Clostridia bacterium]